MGVCGSFKLSTFNILLDTLLVAGETRKKKKHSFRSQVAQSGGKHIYMITICDGAVPVCHGGINEGD